MIQIRVNQGHLSSGWEDFFRSNELKELREDKDKQQVVCEHHTVSHHHQRRDMTEETGSESE